VGDVGPLHSQEWTEYVAIASPASSHAPLCHAHAHGHVMLMPGATGSAVINRRSPRVIAMPCLAQTLAGVYKLQKLPHAVVSQRTPYKVHLNFPYLITTAPQVPCCQLVRRGLSQALLASALPDVDARSSLCLQRRACSPCCRHVATLGLTTFVFRHCQNALASLCGQACIRGLGFGAQLQLWRLGGLVCDVHPDSASHKLLVLQANAARLAVIEAARWACYASWLRLAISFFASRNSTCIACA
jgi:hypothetical protein